MLDRLMAGSWFPNKCGSQMLMVTILFLVGEGGETMDVDTLIGTQIAYVIVSFITNPNLT